MPKAKTSKRSPAKVPTVWDLCLLRDRCRYRLGGLLMRHVPSSRVFRCHCSEWEEGDTGRLLLYAAKDIVAGPRERALGVDEPAGPRLHFLTGVQLAEIAEQEDFESFLATECVLLQPWPVACCPPSRRLPVEYEGHRERVAARKQEEYAEIAPGTRVHLNARSLSGGEGPGTVVESIGSGPYGHVRVQLDRAEPNRPTECCRHEVTLGEHKPRKRPATRKDYEAEIHFLWSQISWLGDVAHKARGVLRALPPLDFDAEWPEYYHGIDDMLDVAIVIGRDEGEPAEGGALPIRSSSRPPVPPIRREGD